MPNMDPDNNVTVRGLVYTQPKYFTTKQGQEFKCSFIIKVMRKHKSVNKDGSSFVGFDLIPVDYFGSDRMQWCHMNIRQGREISAIGPLESSFRDDKFQLTVNAQNVINVTEFEKPSEKVTGSAHQKPLPFA